MHSLTLQISRTPGATISWGLATIRLTKYPPSIISLRGAQQPRYEQ
jgi:hypothetical protein